MVKDVDDGRRSRSVGRLLTDVSNISEPPNNYKRFLLLLFIKLL